LLNGIPILLENYFISLSIKQLLDKRAYEKRIEKKEMSRRQVYKKRIQLKEIEGNWEKIQ